MSGFYIKHLYLKNFKGISELSLDLNDKENVFIGVNGSGKSSILFALSLALSRFTGRIRSTSNNGIPIDVNCIKNKQNELLIEVDLQAGEKVVNWKIGKQYHQTKTAMSNLEQLKSIATEINQSLVADANASLPVCVFYAVGRNVLDVPLKIKIKHQFDQLAAYDGALLRERSVNDFRLFFEWYRNREDIENEQLRDSMTTLFSLDGEQPALNKEDYCDVQLEAVRSAIQNFLPEFHGLKVIRQPLRMVMTKTLSDKKEELDVNQLSDGEKCMLAMVGDLARRLAIANPNLKNPLEGEGIVMIDEVDLHLHPQWEATVMERLQKTFPNCQMIVTTHSPLVLSGLKPETIVVLDYDDHGEIMAEHPQLSKGLTSDEILQSLMVAPYMSSEVKAHLDEIYDLIEQEKWDEAEGAIDALRKQGDIPALIKAKTYLDLCRD